MGSDVRMGFMILLDDEVPSRIILLCLSAVLRRSERRSSGPAAPFAFLFPGRSFWRAATAWSDRASHFRPTAGRRPRDRDAAALQP